MTSFIIPPPPPSIDGIQEETRVALTNAIIAWEDRYGLVFERSDGGFGDPTDAVQRRSEFLAVRCSDPDTLRNDYNIVFDDDEASTEKFIPIEEVLRDVSGLVDDVGDDIANKPYTPTLPVPYSRF
jgi:hypothetical protein